MVPTSIVLFLRLIWMVMTHGLSFYTAACRDLDCVHSFGFLDEKVVYLCRVLVAILFLLAPVPAVVG
jgi:hypothetical protein